MPRHGYMTKERFDADIAKHTMTIVRDDGLDRHLRFVGGDSNWHQWFEILTWRDRLCITGDMGTFVFTRLPDMFEFFRTSDGRINADYWAEKVEAVDRHGSLKHWSSDAWRSAVMACLDEFIENRCLPPQKADPLREAVKIEVEFDDEHEAISSAHEFEYDGQPIFFDMWEHDCSEWSPRFIWCLHAIVWAIEQYDNAKASEAAS